MPLSHNNRQVSTTIGRYRSILSGLIVQGAPSKISYGSTYVSPSLTPAMVDLQTITLAICGLLAIILTFAFRSSMSTSSNMNAQCGSCGKSGRELEASGSGKMQKCSRCGSEAMKSYYWRLHLLTLLLCLQCSITA